MTKSTDDMVTGGRFESDGGGDDFLGSLGSSGNGHICIVIAQPGCITVSQT